MKHGPMYQRVFAVLLTAVLLVGYIPSFRVSAATPVEDLITTVADPQTLTRPESIYGENTRNAGKITVGKAENKIQFVNTTIECDPVDVESEIQKNVVNKTTPGIKPEGFTIALKQGSETLYATTDKNGKASFKLSFDKDDAGKTYELKVYEIVGKIDGVLYDRTIHTVKVEVAVNPDGSLKTLIDGKVADSTKLEFTNTYDMSASAPTSDGVNLGFAMSAMLVSVLCVLFMLSMLKKVRYQGRYSR